MKKKMKRTVLYLLFALLLAGCGSQPQTLSELESEYVTIDDSIRVHYKKCGQGKTAFCFVHGFDGPECREVITGFVSSLAGKETPQEINDYAMSVMPETPQYVASSTMQHLVERKWWPNSQISLPVMVICTQNSGLDPDNKQKMQRLYPNLDYTELTTCGHFIHMEQSAMFNDKLKAFIK